MEFYLCLPENDNQLEFQLSLHSIDWTTQEEVYQMIFIENYCKAPTPEVVCYQVMYSLANVMAFTNHGVIDISDEEDGDTKKALFSCVWVMNQTHISNSSLNSYHKSSFISLTLSLPLAVSSISSLSHLSLSSISVCHGTCTWL